ncbi:MAG: hypothetical protein LBB21_00480, partial [Holosporaceae bacterium]|nr:hypothetical protein [Holosporaceae bacterium]
MKKRIFCATIIGLFAADQSFCTQEAPTSSLFEVSSSSPSVNKATMTRRNSMISYQKAIATSRKIFTFDEFLRNIDRFAQDNEWKSAAADISGAYNEANNVLHAHSDKFGCKKMIHKNDANNVIYTVDISWPAVKQYAEKAIEKENLSKIILSSLLRFNKNESVMLDLSDLNKILKYTKDIKENESEQGVTAISSDQINALEKLCIGKNRLFCIDKLEESYQENFREMFKCAIKNYTGFQRIMSLLAMFILNTNKDRGYAIVDGARPIAIEAMDGESSHYSQSEKTIRLQRRYLDLSDAEGVYVFVHEATHAFHYMLCPDGFGDFLSLSVYASLNAENANFLQLFFPALAKEVMDPIVTIVENKMGGDLPVGTIKEGIENKGKSTAWLYEIFKFLINAGFANVIFDKDVLDKDGGDNFKLSNILTSTHIARAIYILAFAFGKE